MNKKNNKIKLPKARKAWSSSEVKELKKLAKKNAPFIVMEIALQRSKDSIYSKALKEGIPLRSN